MPQALAGVIIAAVKATGVVAALITATVTVGFTMGVNALLGAVFGRGRPKPSDGQQNVRIAIGSRRRHYGIVHTGGQETFLESRDGTLAKVVTLGTGREAEILEHRINDRPVTVSGGTVAEASYHNAIHIYTRPGTDDQTAVAELTAKFPEWTADHRQRGCALAAIVCDPVKQEHFSEVFNGQIPVYTQIRKAALLYDPRKDSTAGGDGAHRLDDPDSWEWSDNAALVIADYFAHPDGYGGGYDNVNWANVAAEADRADETVSTASAETIARWRIWASYGLASEERRQVLADMLKAVDGFIWQDADGRFNLMLGRFEEPDTVITDDHIISMTASFGPKARHRVSALKVLYTEAAIGYREQESATRVDPDAEEDPNTDPQAVEAFFAPHHNQAARLGKILLGRMGARWHLTLVTNLFGLNLLGKRFCRVETAALGVSAYFMVSGLRLNLADCTVEAALDEVRPEDWDFDAATEEGEPPAAPEPPSATPELAAPTGLALAAIDIELGETNAVAIEAMWDDPGRLGLSYEAQYRTSAGGAWVVMAVEDEARTARSGPVNSGTEYEVRVRARSIGGLASAWSAVETITPTAEPLLAPPTSLTAMGAAGEVDLSFRMPASPSLAYARLYRAASNDFGLAGQVGADIVGGLGEVMEVKDAGLAPATYYFWARAFDGAGGSSALAGPVIALVS